MDLSTIKWVEYNLNEVFQEIERGKRIKKGDHIAGIIPYISSTSLNNGVDAFIGNIEKVKFFENCLTIANSGSVGATFYQPYQFIPSDHVTKLENKAFSKYIYLFISTITKRLNEKYSFNREINDKRIHREKIILPANEKGQPDYIFMENYMRFREKEKIDNVRKFIAKRIEILESNVEVNPLSYKEWKCFEIGKLFTLVPGKSKGLNHLQKCSSGINYLGATNTNNGVLAFVSKEGNERMIQKGNSIAFIRNGEGSMGYSIYKAEDFIATSDISVGYSKHLNREIGLFITTIADRIRGKYNFGYKRSDTRLKKERIQLPVNIDGDPDYDYMTKFIKKLEYQKLSNYLKSKSLDNY
ncbi:restriction endonuclease subunit S [Algoriphagus aquimarinus]|uniref:restriction endonuclease subunit S n=1 Tax=Algoriphagus aquimarinus TaxID=237018 RepID=UPI0030D758A0|tara:strand:- start:53549 stop:54616 length:1068 start_codon:yes stop_codon:yes gene_type:complete